MFYDEKLIEKAYKKLKSSVYYDKTQLSLRNRIIEFEMEHPDDELDSYLKELYNKCFLKNDFKELTKTILDKMDVISLPKKLSQEKSDIVTNSVTTNTCITELQHYIDMSVEGHILGMLWILLLGYKLDNNIYEHSYGNRIRKNLISELSDKVTYSPYLFQPYFEQYESWRDKAMSEAQCHMSSKQDVVIMTMDFKRYYYSLDINSAVMKDVLDSIDKDELDDDYKECRELLNTFVGEVIERYSSLFEKEFGGRNILPIGFLPSNILGNWCLNKFDKAIIDGWNPVYYGRYVDDVIIVDKVERNSLLYKKAKDNSLKREDIIDFFLTSCSKWSGLAAETCENQKKYAVLQLDEDLTKEENEDYPESKIKVYSINKKYNPGENNQTKIVVHNEKMKMFYFKWDESDALITCFKSNISKNKSEFRHLPEDEAVFQRDDYSDIYSLESNESVNKFRGIDGITIDKYELSKFLGKYLRIGGMISDKAESMFEKDILKIFNKRAIIENYSMWEKIIEILTINERFSAIEKFCKRINGAIEAITGEKGIEVEKVKKSLYIQLYASICRSFALVWKNERIECQKNIYENFLGQKIHSNLDEIIMGYCDSRMIDKSVMPIMYDMIDKDKLEGINLTRFAEVLSITIPDLYSKYKYYPYIIGMYDFNIATCIEQLNGTKENAIDMLEKNKERYIRTNYLLEKYQEHESYNSVNANQLADIGSNIYLIDVGKSKKTQLRVAIANVRLHHINFERIVKDCPDRSYSRYKELTQIVNKAIDQKVDMLIMPEAYVPFEWLATLARTCAKNSMAVVTGVEHVKFENDMYNYTATILPYQEDSYSCAHISFHLKTHYAPSEAEEIMGYRLTPQIGKSYELYKWNDCYFPVYCCYELTSIKDRSFFQSYADMLVAVEWNRDVKYYSNILESLSRDIHCYCIQVNSSDYGDSRITKPSKSEEKDIIRTKGGINSSILVEDINIPELRNFQLKEYSLQKKESRFKSTPPDFDKQIIFKKVTGKSIIKKE